MTPADYPALRLLLDVGAQLVEVLPAGEYYEMHLPKPNKTPTSSAFSFARLVGCCDTTCD